MSHKGHKHHKHHHSKHHHSKHHEEPSDDQVQNEEEQAKQLSSNEIESLRSSLMAIALPILIGKDGETNKWQLYSGKSLETGMIYMGQMPDYGTVWKVEFILECSAETMYKSITQDLDINWIPHLAESHVLARHDDCVVLQQRIDGVAAVSDRDFVFAQFPGKVQVKRNNTEVTTYYSLTKSIADGYYNTKSLNCVRGEYLPSGWAWTNMEKDSQGRERCHSVLIYNLDLKGFLFKKVVNLAASSFLSRHVKAAQEHAANLAPAANNQDIIIPSGKSANNKKH